MNPRWPVFIPSKGRWESRLTVRAFDRVGVPYRVVVEPQEVDRYASVIDRRSLLVLDHRDLGLVATRNWIWEYAEAIGTRRFWTFDDNIQGLYRLNRNLKTPVASGTILRVIEDFVDRYENVPIAGMNYFMFASRKEAQSPITFNTRVYSNMLIETRVVDRAGVPFRNEGFYNDDTDLCLRVLKNGYCTALFNAFLIYKSTTMTVGGGMTPHYQDDGRYKMAKELADKHPDVARVSFKWGRYQHHVDYSRFRGLRLVPRDGARPPSGVDNYGMRLVRKIDGRWTTITCPICDDARVVSGLPCRSCSASTA